MFLRIWIPVNRNEHSNPIEIFFISDEILFFNIRCYHLYLGQLTKKEAQQFPGQKEGPCMVLNKRTIQNVCFRWTLILHDLLGHFWTDLLLCKLQYILLKLLATDIISIWRHTKLSGVTNIATPLLTSWYGHQHGCGLQKLISHKSFFIFSRNFSYVRYAWIAEKIVITYESLIILKVQSKRIISWTLKIILTSSYQESLKVIFLRNLQKSV